MQGVLQYKRPLDQPGMQYHIMRIGIVRAMCAVMMASSGDACRWTLRLCRSNNKQHPW